MRKNNYLRTILSALLIVIMATAPVLASDSVSVDMLNFNVAGLPGIINSGESKNIPRNQAAIGRQINKSGCQIIAVQEDFGYHKYLASKLKNYPFRTPHSGGIPGGDGMNIYSKYPIFNAKRTPWNMTYGVIEDGADELTPKGILYSVVYVGEGIFVDLYDIHADAYDGEGSIRARNDNFKQLARMIRRKNTGRPVIITGDFNTASHLEQGSAFTEIMIEDAGFKDAWTELKNGGNYCDYSYYAGNEDYQGNWDSLEKFLYRDGDGVTVIANSFEYVPYTNCKGKKISDHSAARATFTFTKTADFKPNKQCLYVAMPNPALVSKTKIRTIIKDLGKIIANKDDLIELLQGLQ